MNYYIKLPKRAGVDETGEFPITTENERRVARCAMEGRYSSAPIWARENNEDPGYQTGEWFNQKLPWQSHPLYKKGSYMTEKEYRKKYPMIFEAAYWNRVDR